jgi:hypothetical protein
MPTHPVGRAHPGGHALPDRSALDYWTTGLKWQRFRARGIRLLEWNRTRPGGRVHPDGQTSRLPAGTATTDTSEPLSVRVAPFSRHQPWCGQSLGVLDRDTVSRARRHLIQVMVHAGRLSAANRSRGCKGRFDGRRHVPRSIHGLARAGRVSPRRGAGHGWAVSRAREGVSDSRHRSLPVATPHRPWFPQLNAGLWRSGATQLHATQ